MVGQPLEDSSPLTGETSVESISANILVTAARDYFFLLYMKEIATEASPLERIIEIAAARTIESASTTELPPLTALNLDTHPLGNPFMRYLVPLLDEHIKNAMMERKYELALEYLAVAAEALRLTGEEPSDELRLSIRALMRTKERKNNKDPFVKLFNEASHLDGLRRIFQITLTSEPALPENYEKMTEYMFWIIENYPESCSNHDFGNYSRDAREDKAYKEAIFFDRQIVKRFPNDPRAWLRLSQYYECLGKTDNAVAAIEQHRRVQSLNEDGVQQKTRDRVGKLWVKRIAQDGWPPMYSQLPWHNEALEEKLKELKCPFKILGKYLKQAKAQRNYNAMLTIGRVINDEKRRVGLESQPRPKRPRRTRAHRPNPTPQPRTPKRERTHRPALKTAAKPPRPAPEPRTHKRKRTHRPKPAPPPSPPPPAPKPAEPPPAPTLDTSDFPSLLESMIKVSRLEWKAVETDEMKGEGWYKIPDDEKKAILEALKQFKAEFETGLVVNPGSSRARKKNRDKKVQGNIGKFWKKYDPFAAQVEGGHIHVKPLQGIIGAYRQVAHLMERG